MQRLARDKAEAAEVLVRAEPDYAKAFILAADTASPWGAAFSASPRGEHEAADTLSACAAATTASIARSA